MLQTAHDDIQQQREEMEQRLHDSAESHTLTSDRHNRVIPHENKTARKRNKNFDELSNIHKERKKKENRQKNHVVSNISTSRKKKNQARTNISKPINSSADATNRTENDNNDTEEEDGGKEYLSDSVPSIPNSTRTDSAKTQSYMNGWTDERTSADLKAARPLHSHGYQHRHPRHRDRKERRKKMHKRQRKESSDSFTTEASIRRVAAAVVRESEVTWRNQSAVLRQNLNSQAKLLTRIKEKLDTQDTLWTKKQEEDLERAKEHRQQQDALLSLRDEVHEMQRLQDLQHATFREMEMSQRTADEEDEHMRFRHYVDNQERNKISNFLKELNLTTLGEDVELIKGTNGFNISNIFIFPRAAAVGANYTSTSVSRVQQRHSEFLSSKSWLDETCYDRNGTKKECSLKYQYSDPCVHFFCTSLCVWNEDDCKDFELGPPSFQCPYAKCEELDEEDSLLWLWILLPASGTTVLGKYYFLHLFIRARAIRRGTGGEGDGGKISNFVKKTLFLFFLI